MHKEFRNGGCNEDREFYGYSMRYVRLSACTQEIKEGGLAASTSAEDTPHGITDALPRALERQARTAVRLSSRIALNRRSRLNRGMAMSLTT